MQNLASVPNRHLAKTPSEIKAIYKVVIDRLIETYHQILDNVNRGEKLAWKKPWSPNGALHANALRPSRIYSCFNQLSCDMYNATHGWSSKAWITLAGIEKLDGTLLPWSEPEFIYGFIPTLLEEGVDPVKSDEGWKLSDEKTDNMIYEVKYYIWKIPVYNIDQCTGLNVKKRRRMRMDSLAERVINDMPLKPPIFHESINSAYYSSSSDTIHLPLRDQFKSMEHYRDTAFHELAHSTGHLTRLDLEKTGWAAEQDSPEYAQEEMIAEIARCLLGNTCGLKWDRCFENNANYILSWFDILKKWRDDNPQIIAICASKAQQAAADYILGRDPKKRSKAAKKTLDRVPKEQAIGVNLSLDIDPIFPDA